LCKWTRGLYSHAAQPQRHRKQTLGQVWNFTMYILSKNGKQERLLIKADTGVIMNEKIVHDTHYNIFGFHDKS